MKIHPQFESNLTVQAYGNQVKIDGVVSLAMALQGDDGGNFSEIARLHNGKVVHADLQEEFEVKQISMSVMTPGAIKAYHIHQKQDDIWYVPPSSRVIVNLHDLRENSQTFDLHQRVMLGGGKNNLLYIPKGVAHGVANMYERDMILFYLTNQQFDAKNPDEYRLPWDAFGKDVWEITKG